MNVSSSAALQQQQEQSGLSQRHASSGCPGRCPSRHRSQRRQAHRGGLALPRLGGGPSASRSASNCSTCGGESGRGGRAIGASSRGSMQLALSSAALGLLTLACPSQQPHNPLRLPSPPHLRLQLRHRVAQPVGGLDLGHLRGGRGRGEGGEEARWASHEARCVSAGPQDASHQMLAIKAGWQPQQQQQRQQPGAAPWRGRSSRAAGPRCCAASL